MRILLLHGYLLRGTGSNVYNAKLAEALRGLGHEVHVCCQEPEPEGLEWVDAVGRFDDAGVPRLPDLRTDGAVVGRAVVWRPPIGRLLPVYVADRYAGFDAKPMVECTDAELEDHVARAARAVRSVATAVRVEGTLANHAVLSPAIAARAGLRAAVKLHGSALEFAVRPQPRRFVPLARAGLDPAPAVLVGSRHTAEVAWELVGDGAGLRERTRLGPPGVDVEQFAPRDADAAAEAVRALSRAVASRPPSRDDGGSFAADPRAAAQALGALRPGEDRLVAFVGKLLGSKGVDLLLAAWPLVLAREPRARLVVVGFGALEGPLRAMAAALSDGDLDAAARVLAGVPGASGGSLVRSFLASEAARSTAYRDAGRRLAERVVWTGRMEHADLAELLPACEAQVVPSTFPEAFGMVAAEAAACATLPVVADHSGLAEVADALAVAMPAGAAPLVRFSLGGDPVAALADRLVRWLEAGDELRARTREALAATARERFSWEGVARGVVAATQGRLDTLARP